MRKLATCREESRSVCDTYAPRRFKCPVGLSAAAEEAEGRFIKARGALLSGSRMPYVGLGFRR